MSTFTVKIKIAAADVVVLKNSETNLYAFRAVAASGTGAITLWQKIESKDISTKVTLTWQEKYSAYNSTSEVKDRSRIRPGNKVSVSNGQLVTIDTAGNLSVSNLGEPRGIAFINNAPHLFTVGLLCQVGTASAKHVSNAFTILGSGAARAIQPMNKVALIFSPAGIDIDTIVARAPSNGVLIDVAKAVNDTREIDFSIADGWRTNGRTWATVFDALEDLPTLLISQSYSSANIEERLTRTTINHEYN